MKSIFILYAFVLISTNLVSQNIELVEDCNPGIEGSIEGRVIGFQNTLLYVGENKNGERGMIRYDDQSNTFTTAIAQSQLDNPIGAVISDDEDLFIFTIQNNQFTTLYHSIIGDLSDLTMIYSPTNAMLNYIEKFDDIYIIGEQANDGTNKSKISMFSKDVEVTELIPELEGHISNYVLTVIDDYLLLGAKNTMINGEFLNVLNLNPMNFVNINEVIPDYTNCGFFSNISTIKNRIIYYGCDKRVSYDLLLKKELLIDFDNHLPLTVSGDIYYYLGLGQSNTLNSYNLTTNENELIFENIQSLSASENYTVFTQKNNGMVDISYLHLENGQTVSHQTGISEDDFSFRATSVGEVPNGLHTIFFKTNGGNGILAKVDSEAFEIIDSVYNIFPQYQPVAINEDIYFTHAHPEYGRELFKLDYITTPTGELEKDAKVSISPNPTTGMIIINPTNVELDTIEVYDSHGILIKKTVSSQISLLDFPSGLYILKIMTKAGNTYTEKVMKI